MSERDREFTRYVEARGGALLRTAVFLCAGDRAGAEDLVQASLVRAYIAWHRVRDEGARDAYVRRIMVRESYRRPRATTLLAEQLVGTETQQPYSFTSRYVLVRPTGDVADLPVSTLVAEGAQEAVVSPDGTEFTGGGDILDLRDLSVVGRVPDEADILIAWTPVGIVYFADDHYKLWREGEAPIALGSDPGVFATGSDVAIDQCGTITRLEADGTLTRISPHCVLGAWSVSPSGRWAVTAALQLVERRSERAHPGRRLPGALPARHRGLRAGGGTGEGARPPVRRG